MTAQPIKALPDYRSFKRVVRIVVLILVLVTITFSIWKSVKEYELTIRGAELQTRGYASALKEHAERALSEANTALMDVIDKLSEQGGFARQNPEKLNSILALHARNTPQIATIILVNSQGLLVAHSLEVPVKQIDVADSDYFIHHRENPKDDTLFISKPFKNRINGKWRITVSKPIRDQHGTFAGLVAVALDLDYFRSFYSSLDLGKKGKIVMVRRDGVLLLAQPFKDSDYNIDFKKSHLIRTYLPKAEKGTFHIAGGKALLEANSRILSYDSLSHFPIVAMTNMGVDEVTADWLKNSVLQAFLTLFVSVALWILAIVLLRQIRRIEDAHAVQLEQQKEILESAKAWQTTFDAVGAAIWIMDLDRHILQANKATEVIFGKDNDDVIGQLCCTVAHQEQKPLSACPFQRMLDTGFRASMQINLNGRWYDVSVDPIKNEFGEIVSAVHIVSDITDIKKTEEFACESEARIKALLKAIPDAIFFKDAKGRWILANHAGIELFTLEHIEYFQRTNLELSEIIPQFLEPLQHCHTTDEETWVNGTLSVFEEYIPSKSGVLRTFQFSKIPIFKEDGSRHGLVAIGRDVTEQQMMEQQLRQAQKMEAIGHLAGGIAHDFNNLLTPILGYSEMIAARLSPSDPMNSKLSGITAAAHKAKDLTQQLLSFGRRQQISTTVLNVNDIVESFHIILRRTIRESITLKLLLDPAGAYIVADRSQIEQIILNMTVNAQDALDYKGEISIETCRVYMEGENVRLHPGMITGDYILIAFHDNGCGMSHEVLAHIFEPFFTTKGVGHGTGLGLATVYGIVKQHNGYISVNSREGEGTTFRVYFPATSIVPFVETKEKVVPVLHKELCTQTLLLVEDNEMVREMVQEMLEGYGYKVLVAADAVQAVEIVSKQLEDITLMVSDVVMPGMSGPELYEQLIVKIPELKVVFISGYPMNPSLRGGTLEEEVSCYLQKPFTAEALIERIRLVLG